MRKRSFQHTFSDNPELRKRHLESEIARAADAADRERLKQQIKELEAARHMEGWLRSTELRRPT